MATSGSGEHPLSGISRRLARGVRGAAPRAQGTSSGTTGTRSPRTGLPVRPGSASSPPTRTRFVTAASRHGKPLIPLWLQRGGLGAWAIIGLLAVLSVGVFAVAQVWEVFTAVFIALVLTAILNPFVDALARHVARWFAVLVVLLAFLGVFAGLMTLVVTSVAGQWARMVDQFSNGVTIIADFLQRLPFHITLTAEDIAHWSDTMLQRAQDWVATNWGNLAGDVLSNVGSVALVFTVLALALFVTVFFLHSGAQMWRWFIDLLPDRYRPTTHRAATAGWDTFSAYARGTMIVAGTDGILAAIFLQVIGVPVAPALGVLVFIGAFIPLIGAPLAMLVAMVVALATSGLLQAALVGVGIALIGQLEGHVLQPLIMGHQVSLHPVVVGIGVAVGTLTAGLLGAVIAIPVIAVFWAVFSELHQGDPPVEGPLPRPPRA